MSSYYGDEFDPEEKFLLGVLGLVVLLLIGGGLYLAFKDDRAHTSFCLNSDGQSNTVRTVAAGDAEDGLTLVVLVKAPASSAGAGVKFGGLTGPEIVLGEDEDRHDLAVATLEIDSLGAGDYPLQFNGRNTGGVLKVIPGEAASGDGHDAGECSVG